MIEDSFRRTSIRGKHSKHKSKIEGDLVGSGALIFTRTCIDLYTIRQTDGFWRLLIRMIQWIRWNRINGDPSKITHVVGWDGTMAFGSDLCDPEGGGLNRHTLPIVPHCFLKHLDQDQNFLLSEESIEVVNKKRNSQTIRIQDLALGDYEVIHLPQFISQDYLVYQQCFRSDDISYSLILAAKTLVTNSRFSLNAKKKAVAYGIYAILNEPFRNPKGEVLQVCCSTFQAMLLMAVEHKQRLEKIIFRKDFSLREKWQNSFNNLKEGYKELNKLHHKFLNLKKDFNESWEAQASKKSKETHSKLIELCLDYQQEKDYLLQKMQKLSRGLSSRIYEMGDEFYNEGLYEAFIDSSDNKIVFDMNPENVTPAKLYFFLYEKIENEP